MCFIFLLALYPTQFITRLDGRLSSISTSQMNTCEFLRINCRDIEVLIGYTYMLTSVLFKNNNTKLSSKPSMNHLKWNWYVKIFLKNLTGIRKQRDKIYSAYRLRYISRSLFSSSTHWACDRAVARDFVRLRVLLRSQFIADLRELTFSGRLYSV